MLPKSVIEQIFARMDPRRPTQKVDFDNITSPRRNYTGFVQLSSSRGQARKNFQNPTQRCRDLSQQKSQKVVLTNLAELSVQGFLHCNQF
jgi:hypothetical protein